jgi:hypothetical protein
MVLNCCSWLLSRIKSFCFLQQFSAIRFVSHYGKILPMLGKHCLMNCSLWLIYYTDGPKEKMRNGKDENGCWGYEEEGERQLKATMFATYHKQHKCVMLKIGRKAQVKQWKHLKWERMCPVRSRKWSGWELSCDRKRVFGLILTEIVSSTWQLSARYVNTNLFFERKVKAGRKWLKCLY